MGKFARYSGFILIFLCACGNDASDPLEESGYLTGARNAKLFYRVIGSGQDTVVVIHGGPGAGMNSILPAVQALSQKFVLIFYDQRGGGKSELPKDTTELQAGYFVNDLEAVRKHFKLSRMNIIAHSFGSILLAEYAQKYPQHLDRVVFHGATGPRRSQAARYYMAKAAATSDTTMLKHSYVLMKTLLSGSAADPIATCEAYERISRELAISRGESGGSTGSTCQASAEAVKYYYRYTAQLTPASFGDWDYTAIMRHVSAPLLVIYGQNDTLAHASQEAWVHAVPNGRLLLVPEAWKAAVADNPSFTLQAIGQFFEGEWPESSQYVDH